MAYPETTNNKRDPFADPMRDPTGTDPNSHSNTWTWVIGFLAAMLVALYVYSSAVGPAPVQKVQPSEPAPSAAPVNPAVPVTPAPAPAPVQTP